jgi:cytokinin dehydrogenase
MHDRRAFLRGLGGVAAGAALVTGWSPLRRSWVGRALADEPYAPLPPLDGSVHTDPGTRRRFTEDFGRLLDREPAAVLKPGSVDDIVTIIRYAREHGIRVAMNGQAGTDDRRESHSQYGQAQVEGGIAIDPKPLAMIHGIDPQAGIADVSGGVRWAELFDAAAAFGLAPAVMTDYMHLSIGGTLSVGGIGGHTGRLGTQADQVVELEVVTGAGQRLRCSPHERRELFDAVLAGCGQVALIVRAKLKLLPARSHGMVFNLYYDDLDTYVRDQIVLTDDRRFDYQEGSLALRDDGSGWRYVIEVVKYFDAPDQPDADALLAGLSDDRPSAEIFPTTFREWQFRIDPFVLFLKAQGLWDAPHPWLSVWIPGSQTAAYMEKLASRLTPNDLGFGVALLYPIDTRSVQRPLFRLPDERIAFHLSLLRFPPNDATIAAAMLADNRRIYDEVVRLGGTRYASGAIPDMSPRDWQRHFRPVWGKLVSAKRRYDPDDVLTPGWGMFPWQ